MWLMEPTELLRVVGDQRDRIGCQRFTTGSVASMVFGEPRCTHDIASMIAVQGAEDLDWSYLEHWSMRLGVASELERVRPKP